MPRCSEHTMRGPILTIHFMDGQTEQFDFDGDDLRTTPVTWMPTSDGLLVKWAVRGTRRMFPWQHIRSYGIETFPLADWECELLDVEQPSGQPKVG